MPQQSEATSPNELAKIVRTAVVMDFINGRSDDDIYRRRIDAAVRSARELGVDEASVETIAAETRRSVAAALAELQAAGYQREER